MIRESILTLAILTTTVCVGWSQVYEKPANPRDIPKEQIEASGTLKGVRGGVLYVLTEDGGQWGVNIERNAQRIQYVGSADGTWLRPGMFLEFTTTVNARGEGVAPLTALTVMTPSKENPPGVQAEASGGSELFEVKEEKEKPKEETAKVRVVGQITAMKDGLATVSGGNATVRVAISPEARISIEVSGPGALQLIQPEDKIQFRGWYVQNYKGQAWANQLSISGTNSFTNKKAEPNKPAGEAANPAASEKKE